MILDFSVMEETVKTQFQVVEKKNYDHIRNIDKNNIP